MTQFWLTDFQIVIAAFTALAAFVSGIVAAVTGVLNLRRLIKRAAVAKATAKQLHDCIHSGQIERRADAGQMREEMAEIKSMLATLLDTRPKM